LKRLVEEAVARAARRSPLLQAHPAHVRYDGFICEGCAVAPDEPLVSTLAAAYESVHGAPPALRATTATTDARHYVRSGIPTVCFGPRGEAGHGIDERVSIASMRACSRVLARFIVSWCGVA
jgi:acetylornithine deacetylase